MDPQEPLAQRDHPMLAAIPAVPTLPYSAFGRRAYVKDATAVRGVAPVGL